MKFRSVIVACQSAAVFALSSVVGSFALAAEPAPALDEAVRAELARVVARPLAPAVDEAGQRKAVAWTEAEGDLWWDLFGALPPGEGLNYFTLDFRTDRPGVVPGTTSTGEPFNLIAVEVTPIRVDDIAVSAVVGAENLDRFVESRGEASLVIGYIVTDKSARAVLAAAASYKTDKDATETILMPLAASVGQVEVCEIDIAPAIDIDGGPVVFTPNIAGGGDVAMNGGRWGYCRCVLHVLKCELYSAACILAAPACVATCAGVCTGTIGLGCIACIVACAGAGVAMCDAALDCWRTASAKGCVPW